MHEKTVSNIRRGFCEPKAYMTHLKWQGKKKAWYQTKKLVERKEEAVLNQLSVSCVTAVEFIHSAHQTFFLKILQTLQFFRWKK